MKTLHVISHTHWDREWYLTFQQFRLKLVHLIDHLLNILEEDSEYLHFMLDGQTIVLDDYLQIRPEMEGVLKQHIQSGRLLIGPWHILPDMFLVSPEAHIRNLLQGDRTASKFGSKMQIGYIPDPFGHPGQIPQILRGFGIEVAALWRGVSDFPAEIWWESPDGTKVLMAYLRDSYGNGANLPVYDPELFANQIAEAGNSLAAHSAVSDYLIMLGTDHMEPSPYTSAAIAYADQNLPETRVFHSTLPNYIKSISEQISKIGNALPVLKGELRACDRSPLLPGVLSARMWIKQRNHYSQTLLEKWAEPFSVFAEQMVGTDSSQSISKSLTRSGNSSRRVEQVAQILRHAWRLLMENHPHDSICGCSIDQVHDEMKPRFDQVDQIGEEITQQALQTLSSAVNTSAIGAFTSIVIFNPHGFAHRDRVEAELTLPEEISAFEIIDENQAVIPHTFLGSGNDEIANVFLEKRSFRSTIGAIAEGYIGGSAIIRVRFTRQGPTVRIDAVMDEGGQPDESEWRQAEKELKKFEADPTVTHFHVIAHSPQSSRIAFISPEIPALGWRTVWVRARDESQLPPPAEINTLIKPFIPLIIRVAQSRVGEKLLMNLRTGDEDKPPFVIENERFSVEASHMDGTLTITDKRTGTVYSGLNRFVDGGDGGDEYNYSPPASDQMYSPTVKKIKVFRHRPTSVLEIEYLLKVPAQLSHDRKSRSDTMVSIPILSRVLLADGIDRIDVHTELDNLAEDHRLRVHFPAPVEVAEAAYDGHFEVVQRPLGVPQKGDDWVEDPRPEVPQRAFTEISDGKIGLMIANRGLPEVEVCTGEHEGNTEIVLTLLRCVGWLSRDDLVVRPGHAGPGLATPGSQMIGPGTYDYAIIPHNGDWREAYQLAYGFETSLRVVQTPLQQGSFLNKGSFISHTPKKFIISAIKESENGTGWIVRGYNISSEPVMLQIKPLQHFSSARLVNLAETEISMLDFEPDGSIITPALGHQIVSVKFS